MAMVYTVYRVTSLITGDFYIGVHKTDNPDDNYLGSGDLIRQAVKTHGRSQFVKTILATFDHWAPAYEMEQEVLTNLLGTPGCLNIHQGGKGGYKFGTRWKGSKHSEAARKRISDTHKGKGNPQYGSRWMLEPSTGAVKKVPKGEIQKMKQLGWVPGARKVPKSLMPNVCPKCGHQHTYFLSRSSTRDYTCDSCKQVEADAYERALALVRMRRALQPILSREQMDRLAKVQGL